ncbi:hypothetical protein [Alienimonas chondri]|uniref:hypothetical protein n=1 Tax=Alienimonas chondri TaxID=2681879 RepID=UPI001489EC69|nr:hypothetical protein [Alienimonas chondri]
MGFPLGTELLLAGTVEYRRLRRRHKQRGFSVLVTHVNERPWAAAEPRFDLPDDAFAASGIEEPSAESEAVGQSIELVAYETGGFYGLTKSAVPDEALPAPDPSLPVLPPLAGRPFQFVAHLEVVGIVRGPGYQKRRWGPPLFRTP